MKIIINENSYITILSEEMGVPSNIINVANIIYKKILSYINSMNDKYGMGNTGLVINGNFKINDYVFKTINIILNFHDSQNNDDVIILYNLSVGNAGKFTDDRTKIISTIGNTITINMDFSIPNNKKLKKTDIINFLTIERADTTSKIAHELLHAFENIKKTTRETTESVNYRVIQDLQMGIKPLDDFTYLLYYMSKVEDVTRPSELATHIKTNKITKSGFLNYINNKSTPIIPILKIAKKFTYQKLYNKLLKQISQIDDFAKRNKNLFNSEPELKNFQNFSDQQKIDIILQIYLSSFYNRLKNDLVQTIMVHPFDFLDKQKQEYIANNLKKIIKSDNYKDFFVYYEKLFKFATDKTLRKIYKLYDMAIDDSQKKKTMFDKENLNEKNSIHNWDIFQEMKTNPKKDFYLKKDLFKEK